MVITADTALGAMGILGSLIGALVALAFSYGRSRQQLKNIDAELFGYKGGDGLCHKVDAMMGKLDNGLLQHVKSIDEKLDKAADTTNQLNTQVAAMQSTVDQLNQTVNRLPCTQPRNPSVRERRTDGG
jgi:predicted acylesterase/phospholipase RssA